MNQKGFTNIILIVIVVAIVVIGGYLVYQRISKTPLSEIQSVYTVDELVKSNIREGTEVLVRGKYTMRLINAGPDYEGPGGGNYLDGETKSIFLEPQEDGLGGVELNQAITVKGKVGYCGGKKITKYICELTNTGLMETSTSCISNDDCAVVKDTQHCCHCDTVINKKYIDYWNKIAIDCPSDRQLSCKCAVIDSAVCEGSKCIPSFQARLFEHITLSSWNWEALGSTIKIEKDGSYTVEFGRPGQMETKEGRLTVGGLGELTKIINTANNVDVFSLDKEYTGPKETTRSWMQYNLIIETESGSKSVSFHSEDGTVPAILHDIVNKIFQLTK